MGALEAVGHALLATQAPWLVLEGQHQHRRCVQAVGLPSSAGFCTAQGVLDSMSLQFGAAGL